MLALGVDTSNYATSLAVVDAAAGEVVCTQKRFLPVKEGQAGLRQSDAVFHHTAALPQMAQQLCQSLGARAGEIGAVGASGRPRPVEGSYMPCFLAGVSFASAWAAARGLPLCQTSHQQGHLAAALYGAGADAGRDGPAAKSGKAPGLYGRELIFFHVSGGTTEMLLTRGHEILRPLGESLDLYAGQAIDRLGVRLGFSFPAGEAVSALAAECGEDIRPSVSVRGMDCHLSGLQNQCEGLLEQGRPPAYVARYCLLAVAGTMAAMIAAAKKAHPGLPVLCAGGVNASVVIKGVLEAAVEEIYFAPPALSADNAVGVALIAAKQEGGEWITP